MNFFFFLFFSFIVALSSCSRQSGARTEACMDTVCTVNAFESGSEKLYDKIFARLFQIENESSAFLPGSEISRINSMAGISEASASDDILKMLSASKKAFYVSGGAFTPVAGPLIDMWGIGTDDARIPSLDEIKNTLPLMDARFMELSGNSVFLEKRGMKINLGGIAKGFAADEICSILRENNVERAVLDFGGNICLYGKKPGGNPWVVGIKNPENPSGQPLLRLYTGANSVVTSGSYERFSELGGKRYHHIFDARNGFPADSGVVSATVVSPSGIAADVLSTVTFILGVEKSFSLLDEFKKTFETDISLIFICKYGSVFASGDLNGSLEFVQDTSRELIFIP
ncbi:FAD:protein FMN transferase [Treponema sp.]|uniref:FAD:protein FMN transferase n=1 Tax=Treponema sp. TaxID=166 RepID=UPI003F00F3A3